MRTVKELREFLSLFDQDDLVILWVPSAYDIENSGGLVMVAAPGKANLSNGSDIYGFFSFDSGLFDESTCPAVRREV